MSSLSDQANVQQGARGLQDAGRLFWSRGWSVGTSSNYSTLLGRNPTRILVTASGMDKGALRNEDFVIVDEAGRPTHDGQPKSSAETLLHCQLYEDPSVGAVLHTHSPWATVLSDLFFTDGGFSIEGFEMLKGLAGVATHEHREWIPIFENTQDIPVLAAQVRELMSASPEKIAHAYLIRRHGLYTWGRDLAEARRHIEILEFLFETVAKKLSLAAAVSQPAAVVAETTPMPLPTLEAAPADAAPQPVTRRTPILPRRKRMARVTIPQENRHIEDPEEIRAYLKPHGIWYEKWDVAGRLAEDADDETILKEYAPEIERLKEQGGYVTADVINVTPDTPNLDAMLDKFNKEHTHSEDEVRFTVEGSGLFHIHPDEGPVFAVQVTAGDLINVPAGTRHWFNLCGERTIRCIRLFQDPAGWTPEYMDQGEHVNHAPVCWGPSHLPQSQTTFESIIKP
jgi:1,2-dihydroxy-3-keto-5-methylthiopentene dioxygenase